ncbi:MAG: DUF2497 domain-containing protein [Gemmatimonas sp.]
MSDPKVQGQEPTMEEILASIRRIISEGDDPNAAAAAPAKPAAAPRPASSDGVLELTDMVGADGKVVNIAAAKGAAPAPAEEDTMAEPTDAPAPPRAEVPADDVVLTAADAAQPASAPASPSDDEALMGAATAAASTAAFAALAKTMHRDAPPPSSIPIGSGRTLEELVAEMIRPMLRDWLDANLPGMVERMIKREIERIVRRAED